MDFVIQDGTNHWTRRRSVRETEHSRSMDRGELLVPERRPPHVGAL
jgi:hypothetical protein